MAAKPCGTKHHHARRLQLCAHVRPKVPEAPGLPTGPPYLQSRPAPHRRPVPYYCAMVDTRKMRGNARKRRAVVGVQRCSPGERVSSGAAGPPRPPRVLINSTARVHIFPSPSLGQFPDPPCMPGDMSRSVLAIHHLRRSSSAGDEVDMYTILGSRLQPRKFPPIYGPLNQSDPI